MGGIPTNRHGEALTLKNGNLEPVAGLMAVGEAACVSVHGANRLGSNSLLDLVVFGRAAAHRCAELLENAERHRALPADAGQAAIARLDKFRNANGSQTTAEIRLQMQKIMQSHASVFRTGEILQEGIEKLSACIDALSDVQVMDRGLIWNTDLNRDFRVGESSGSGHDHDCVGGQSQGEPGCSGS